MPLGYGLPCSGDDGKNCGDALTADVKGTTICYRGNCTCYPFWGFVNDGDGGLSCETPTAMSYQLGWAYVAGCVFSVLVILLVADALRRGVGLKELREWNARTSTAVFVFSCASFTFLWQFVLVLVYFRVVGAGVWDGPLGFKKIAPVGTAVFMASDLSSPCACQRRRRAALRT